uniref:Uncharacterized protein n=1 Tax=Kalanchoe fedtschenkoi TaxID=63787 RepID=A0A7N0RC13_KALFE
MTSNFDVDSFPGFLSMNIEADKDQLVIVGVGVDAASLVTSLCKKVGHTRIISIEVVKTEAQKKEEEAKKKKKEEEEEEAAKNRMVTWSYNHCNNYPPPPPPGCDLVCYAAPSYHNSWFTW